ncbi:MAG: DUF5320 domain-containing protein [Candidatus Omnitrophica bacterium]|nr:DUF5320 domain-containing protein [Candidatus Omnitrophota bacterium]
MPGFDGTGPRGQGAMTGGGRGYCAMSVGEAKRQFGRGISGARGSGRGWRNCFYTTGLPGWMRAQKDIQAFGGYGRTLSKENKLSVLKNQAEYIKNELDSVQARVQDLDSK